MLPLRAVGNGLVFGAFLPERRSAKVLLSCWLGGIGGVSGFRPAKKSPSVLGRASAQERGSIVRAKRRMRSFFTVNGPVR